MRIRLGLRIPLAWMMALRETPYFAAMWLSVSPLRITWFRSACNKGPQNNIPSAISLLTRALLIIPSSRGLCLPDTRSSFKKNSLHRVCRIPCRDSRFSKAAIILNEFRRDHVLNIETSIIHRVCCFTVLQERCPRVALLFCWLAVCLGLCLTPFLCAIGLFAVQ